MYQFVTAVVFAFIGYNAILAGETYSRAELVTIGICCLLFAWGMFSAISAFVKFTNREVE